MRQMAEGEPLPLVMMSDDEDEKIEWMVAKLRDVYTAYDKEMPSVGVFVTNGKSVDGFVKRQTEEDDLGEIRIEAASYVIESRVVWYAASLADKVYELKEVKEMEFEVSSSPIIQYRCLVVLSFYSIFLRIYAFFSTAKVRIISEVAK